MIPDSISQNDVIAALDEIDRLGVPPGRRSRKFHLVRSGKHYPPKVVVSTALPIGTGQELDPGHFNGGIETNDFLTNLGFTIVNGASPGSTAHLPKATAASPPCIGADVHFQLLGQPGDELRSAEHVSGDALDGQQLN